MPPPRKRALLARILEYEDPESAIIFCNTKADVRFITAFLAKRGFNIDQISGDLQQSAREKAMAKIKAGKLRFLVATDVAARGIDISDLAYVINYTTSDSPEVYVHRTGRTGRAGKSGVAISLVSGLDIGNFKHMQIVSGIPMTERKAPTDREIARRKKKRAEGDLEEDWKAVQARAEADLATRPTDETQARIERLLPFVKKAAETEEGVQRLAELCAAHLVERPALEEAAATQEGDEPEPSAAPTASEDSEPAEVESATGSRRSRGPGGSPASAASQSRRTERGRRWTPE